MEKAIEYRALAARLRREAAMAALQHARETRLAAAERWDVLASEIEMVAEPGATASSRDWIF